MPNRVVFVLPGPSKKPVGGYKVVYEYSNQLSRAGYEVTIIHPAIIEKDMSFLSMLKRYLAYTVRLLTNSALPKWFVLDEKIKLKWTLSASERHVPDADFVFATAWQTAIWVKDYSIRKGRKLYLIQGLETWISEEKKVFSTWNYSLHKIVISRWLQEKLKYFGEDAAYLPNGLDFETFDCDVAIEERFPKSIAFLFHTDEHKGSSDCLEAVRRIKEIYPDLKVKAFGIPPRPPYLPIWIEYYCNPRPEILRSIYNSVAIFVSGSHSEGWGLTSCEALQCGAALVATDIGGHREFAIDGETALLCKVENPTDMAAKIQTLIEDIKKLQSLAIRGNEFVKRFTWDKSTATLIRLLNSLGD